MSQSLHDIRETPPHTQRVSQSSSCECDTINTHVRVCDAIPLVSQGQTFIPRGDNLSEHQLKNDHLKGTVLQDKYKIKIWHFIIQYKTNRFMQFW